ncbi:MAG: hypothetical protein ABGW85_04390 [Sulfurimonas sp.]
MQISSTDNIIQNLYMKRLNSDEVKKIKQAVVDNANKYTFRDFSMKDYSNKELSAGEQILKNSQDFQKFLYTNGIDGRSVRRISELTFDTPSFLNIKA